ncbi:hypothetical protein L226DRAFT_471436 [Lentinus tigrinus ALCF2SS1-7]|nr:hypothetical protein L226DRAFT_471436 [Lentinus tigrinus ALCF2SS1-7]
MYNICAACAVCSGDDIPQWSSWADENTCDSNPAQFSLPSNVEVDTNLIPRWAYQQLSSAHDFNLQEAVADPDPDSGLSRGAQIAVPIAVAVGVVLLAWLGFLWYHRRQRTRTRYPSRPRSQNLSDSASLFSEPLRWFRELKLSLHSHRLQPSRKDTSWEIDDDSNLLASHSDTPYHDPYSPEDRAHTPSGRNSRASYTGSHARTGSSLSMLSNIEFLDVRVPTFMERFIKFKDGIRKSASYKSKHVSPISPDQGFRIDGEEPPPPPVPPKFHTVADFRRPQNASVPSFSEERRQARAARPTPLEVVIERSDHDPQSEHEHGQEHGAPGMDDVLIISRDGGDNFTINDTATIATGSPRTPSTRQPPSAYSASRTTTLNSASLSPGMTPTRSSWLPSPRRANTSSTVSGAYPHELRRDPDLVAPPSWANRFPDPPQTFSGAGAGAYPPMPPVPPVPLVQMQTQVRSVRTLPTPPGPQTQTEAQMSSPPPPGYTESARTS